MVFLTLLVRAGANAVKKPIRDAYVIGVGMTKFEKPGARVNYDYPEMSKEAGTAALNDAKIKYEEVEQAVCGYVYGDSTCGQRAVYELGMTGIPVYNVNNNCSTGSTALMMARQFVQGGSSECVLALGFEKMERGSLSMKFPDRVSPLDKHEKKIRELEPEESASGAPIAPFYFGAAAKEYMQKYPGTRVEQMAAVAAKNHLHSVHNPYSQFTFSSTVQEVLASPRVAFALTKLQCCPTSDGAAAAVVASEEFVKSHGLEDRAVRIVGQEMVTDMENSFGNSPMYVAGYGMAKRSAELLYRNTGLSPKDFQVVEIHDCFSANEMITYEALGLCEVGKAGEFVERTWLGRDGPVCNPCGGLISKGHPLGATGLAQCAELCWQLRGLCGVRQVPRVKYALQHNIGLGGAVVLTAYTLGWPERVARDPQTGIAAGLGKGKNDLPPHEKALHEILARAQYVKKEAKGGAGKRKNA